MMESIFDYFNLTVKEYYIGIENWCRDKEYVEALKKQYERIDK